VLHASCRDIRHVALDPLPELRARGLSGSRTLAEGLSSGLCLRENPKHQPPKNQAWQY
jgi:hypothetical protein